MLNEKDTGKGRHVLSLKQAMLRCESRPEALGHGGSVRRITAGVGTQQGTCWMNHAAGPAVKASLMLDLVQE